MRANETGFISQFEIYTGKNDYHLMHGNNTMYIFLGIAAGTNDTGLGERVVTNLTKDLAEKNHEVYFDNFFNSVSLQTYLHKNSIYGCGTVRKTRKNFPKDFMNDKEMERGDVDWHMSNTGLMALKWKDNKPVYFLSNFHSPQNIEVISRKQKDGSRKDFNCVKLVNDYNKHMGYVDKMDMYKSCYELDRKSKKWWQRIFWHFLDLTVVNAFLIFKERSPPGCSSTLSPKEFRLSVSNGLIGADPAAPQRGRRSTGNIVNRFKVHVPIERRSDKAAHMPQHGNKVRCARCSTRSSPHRTRWHCSSCGVGLCLTANKNCFLAFHKT